MASIETGVDLNIELPPIHANGDKRNVERSPIRAMHAEQGNFAEEMVDMPTMEAGQRRIQRAFRFPVYRAACAGFMLFFGVACGISSAAVMSFALGIVSVLMVLPGAYMSWVYFQVYRNNPRYTSDRWLGLETIPADQ
jgi:hypothetical protein